MVPLLCCCIESDCQFYVLKCGWISKEKHRRSIATELTKGNALSSHRHWQWPLLATSSQHRGVQRNSQPGQCAFDEAGQVGNCGWPTLTLTVTKLQDHTSSLSSEEARPLRATKRSANMNTCVFFDAQPLFVRKFSTPLQNSSQGLNSVQSHAQSSPFLINLPILHSFKLVNVHDNVQPAPLWWSSIFVGLKTVFSSINNNLCFFVLAKMPFYALI